MKIISKGRGLRTPEFAEKKKRELRSRLVAFLVLLVAVVAGLVYASTRPELLIREVEILGTEVTTDEEVREVVESVLGEKYLWLVPKSNFLIYPRDTLVASLASSIPRLTSIETRLDDKQTLIVSVAERKPDSLYCEDASDILSPKGCYFLDEGGYIFSRAPSFSGAVYFIHTLAKPLETPLGSRLMDEDEFRKLGAFVASLDKIVEARVLTREAGEYELHLASGARIIWKAEDDISLTRANLEAFLTSEDISAEEDFLERVEYIDLRYENKVFYKF